jgi:hypothetical protein
MKRYWTASAVALAAVFLVGGCNDYGNTFQNNTGAAISFISPSNISAGSSDFTLTVSGGGFVAKTKVQWNGQTIATTVTTDTSGNVLSVTARVTAALVAKAGTATVNTLNPASGTGNNGLSNSLQFVINPPPNPLPVFTSINPMSVTAGSVGSAGLSVVLTGTSFLPNMDPTLASQVHWNAGATQTTLVTGNISSTTIQATVPSTLLGTAGTAVVTVYNPPAPPPQNCSPVCNGGGGGGTSVNNVTFTIIAGQVTNGAVEETPAVSLDGRYVAYVAIQNEHSQVFLRDTCEGADASCQAHGILLSAAADGTAANDESHSPSMSSDGRYVAFSSAATNLVANAAPGRQVYLRDTCAGASASCMPSTQLISNDPNGALVGAEGVLPSVSASGRFVAFLAVTPSSAASRAKIATSETNSGFRQVFVRDTCLGTLHCTPKTTRISLQPGDGSESDTKPAGPALSGDAKHVAMASGSMAALFTRSVAVDDRVFLALTDGQ